MEFSQDEILVKERKWFKRTVGWAITNAIIIMAGIGASVWAYRRFLEAKLGATIGPTDLTHPFHVARMGRTILTGTTALLALSGLFFLFSLVSWLLAIRARRKSDTSYGLGSQDSKP